MLRCRFGAEDRNTAYIAVTLVGLGKGPNIHRYIHRYIHLTLRHQMLAQGGAEFPDIEPKAMMVGKPDITIMPHKNFNAGFRRPKSGVCVRDASHKDPTR